MEASEGGLKELVMRWFTDTQESQILDNGNFPDWFQGFAARKDTEDLLRDKALGCFLVRLSDKTIGYILSYKGHERCRHFVITVNKQGQFKMRGDCRTYGSLTELIEFYKVSPIQPFREYLTSSCFQENGSELYDVVNSGKSEVSVLALRNLWDRKHGPSDVPDKKTPTEQTNDLILPPALPPKCENRKLKGAVSLDTVFLARVSPSILNKGTALNILLSESSSFTSDQEATQVDPKRSESLRGTTNSDQRNLEDLYPEGMEFFEQRQANNKSRSSGRLYDITDDESSGPPTHALPPLMKVSCHAYSPHDPELSGSASNPTEGAEMFRSNPLYQASEVPEMGSVQQDSVTYSEVPQRSTSTRRIDNPYESIPKEPVQGNTYESLEEMKTKKKSTSSKSNLKWLNFLPDSKKK
ncbi:SH2 domain-containing protein 7 [Takifugu flavidus]|uniref:SH2 domain-containing protein 7 n=1 Tax=Takifugu flavidus TaxID=433684 RepID=A0A5C6NPN4_9TELE|nr:SH2 domain-containing protein 7 [Takifugu flavidus]TWW67607.1 SH2 domain-containing protein 7 [Takifugu flavidus]